jgi:hypothetical protein
MNKHVLEHQTTRTLLGAMLLYVGDKLQFTTKTTLLSSKNTLLQMSLQSRKSALPNASAILVCAMNAQRSQHITHNTRRCSDRPCFSTIRTNTPNTNSVFQTFKASIRQQDMFSLSATIR